MQLWLFELTHALTLPHDRAADLASLHSTLYGGSSGGGGGGGGRSSPTRVGTFVSPTAHRGAPPDDERLTGARGRYVSLGTDRGYYCSEERV